MKQSLVLFLLPVTTIASYNTITVIEKTRLKRIVLCIDGQSAGKLVWHTSNFNNSHAVIESLYIKPKFRAHGYGRTLLDVALVRLAQQYKESLLKTVAGELA